MSRWPRRSRTTRTRSERATYPGELGQSERAIPTVLPSIVIWMATPPPTLYEWAGGSDDLFEMINAFYDRVEQDELLSPFFPGGVHEDHRRHVATWWAEVLAVPLDTQKTSVATNGC